MKHLIFLLLIMGSMGQVAAQAKQGRPNYQLLWKISGNGLKAPSYLFGTMHVRDKRAFDFSDSVVYAILTCESFALEVHPDSATKVMFLEMLADKENNFKKLLTPADYRELDSLMAVKTGYTLETLKSPAMAEAMLGKRFDREDKETFLDAWLYLYARNQGKQIFGLEDAQKHMDVMLNSPRQNIKKNLMRYLEQPDSLRPSYRKLFDIYHDGDLKAIEKFILNAGQDEPEFYDKLLYSRNHDMLKSIKANIHDRTAFMAVGAAHLPGKEGLIELLERSGYTVTLVQPKFTGVSRKIKIDTNPGVWGTYSFNPGGYSLQMPGEPFKYRIDSIGLTMNIYMDLKGPTFFQTMYTLTNQGQTVTEIFDRIENKLGARGSSTPKGKRYKINGFDALEVPLIQTKQFVRAVYVIRGNVLCMLMVGPTKEVAYQEDADRFIKSFKGLDLKNSKWETYVDETGAYSVLMSGQPRNINRTATDGNMNQEVFIAMSENLVAGEVYLARYSDLPIGYLSTHDSVYHASAAQAFMNRMEGKNLQHVEAVMDGQPAVEYVFDSGPGNQVRTRMTLRGNRYYMLMTVAQKDKPGASDTDLFLNSFKFRDFKRTGLKPHAIDNMRIWLPQKPIQDSTLSENDVKVYNATDPNSGTLFVISKAKFEPYQSSENKAEFFKSDYPNDEGDTVVWTRDISKADMIGHEFIVQSSKTNAIRRIRTMAYGRDLYSFNVVIPANYRGDIDQRFYDSLTLEPTQVADTWNILNRKTDQLLSDLNARDSTVQKAARSVLWEYDFTQLEIPKIYKAIVNPETDYSVKENLLNKLKTIHDSTTLEFISNLYPTLPDSSSIREEALGVLGHQRNEAATRLFLQLIQNDSIGNLIADYTMLSGYYDTLSLLEPIALGLLKSESKVRGNGYLFRMLMRGMEEQKFSESLCQQLNDEYLNIAMAKVKTGLQKPAKDSDDFYDLNYEYEQLATAMTKQPFTPDVKNILLALTDLKWEDVMLETIPYLAKQGVKVKTEYLTQMAADLLYRVDLWEALTEAKQGALFPKKYRTQQKIAEGLLVRYMNYDDYIPEKIEFLGSQKVKHKGIRKTLLTYRCFDGENWYLGLVGPYVGNELIPAEEEFVFNTYFEIGPKDNLFEKVKEALADYEDVEVVK